MTDCSISRAIAPNECEDVQSARAAVVLVDMKNFVRMMNTTLDDDPPTRQRRERVRRRDKCEKRYSRVRTILNEYFSSMANIVDAYDGTVWAFMGDAMLAVWMTDDCRHRSSQYRHLIIRAACCAQSILEHVHGRRLCESFEVELKAVVSAGSVCVHRNVGESLCGGSILSGEAISEMQALKRAMKSGKVVFSATCREFLAESVGAGFLSRTMALGEFGARAAIAQMGDSHPRTKDCTVAFLSFDCHDDLMKSLETVKRDLARGEGILLQAVIDENGPSCLCAFVIERERDTRRAVDAIRAMMENMFSLTRRPPSCGVSSGALNIGSVCDANRVIRHHHSVVGLPVVLSARFANQAERGQIIMDKATRENANLAGVRVVTRKLTLKGFRRDVAAFLIDARENYNKLRHSIV